MEEFKMFIAYLALKWFGITEFRTAVEMITLLLLSFITGAAAVVAISILINS